MGLVAAGTSCFDGADALGLPCRGDEDCGQGQACEQGFCGGPPATSTTVGSSGPGPSGTAVATAADSSSGDTGIEPGCGNGTVEGDEECDPGPGGDAAECDADCTAVVCGDGHANELAGELCDDGNDSSLDECNTDCLPNVFWDDMEDPMRSMDQWLVSAPSFVFNDNEYGLSGDDGLWQLGLPGMPDAGVWHSGTYSTEPGVARLSTTEIMLPPIPGPDMRYELRFRHLYRFDGNNVQDFECMAGAQFSDGAVVWVQEPMQLPQQVAPVMGTGTMLDDLGGCETELPGELPNPMFVLPTPPTVFSGVSSAGAIDVSARLPITMSVVQIVFDVGYDCINCWGTGPATMDPPAPGWIIDDVIVGLFRI